jgi:hypothetical protein
VAESPEAEATNAAWIDRINVMIRDTAVDILRKPDFHGSVDLRVFFKDSKITGAEKSVRQTFK